MLRSVPGGGMPHPTTRAATTANPAIDRWDAAPRRIDLFVGEVVLAGRRPERAAGRVVGPGHDDLRRPREADAVLREGLEEELPELAAGRPLLRRADLADKLEPDAGPADRP